MNNCWAKPTNLFPIRNILSNHSFYFSPVKLCRHTLIKQITKYIKENASITNANLFRIKNISFTLDITVFNSFIFSINLMKVKHSLRFISIFWFYNKSTLYHYSLSVIAIWLDGFWLFESRMIFWNWYITLRIHYLFDFFIYIPIRYCLRFFYCFIAPFWLILSSIITFFHKSSIKVSITFQTPYVILQLSYSENIIQSKLIVLFLNYYYELSKM